MLTLDSGLIIPVFVNSSTQNIHPIVLGWHRLGEDFKLSNGWKVRNYNAGYFSDNTIGIGSTLSKEKKVGETRHEVFYFADFATHDLNFHYEAKDNQNKFTIFMETHKQQDSLVLETMLIAKSQITGDEFKFHFDENGVMIAITYGKKPLSGSVVEINIDEDMKAQGKRLGQEVAVMTNEEEVDLHDTARVNEICKTYLGVIPNIDMRLKIDNIATIKSCMENIDKPENEMQSNPRSLIAFNKSTIKQDIRAFG